MSRYATSGVIEPHSALPAVVELLKPITWFPPMWALACGVVSTGVPLGSSWGVLLAGVLLAGPLVCATSQAANDWFDRHVDAINEPHRPIPSGRLPGRTGLYVAIAWTVLSLAVATSLGAWGFGAAVVGLALAWGYSAPPLRFKRNGWYGNSACAACYEGLPWFTGAALMVGTLPDAKTIAAAVLYSIGAHGIMTLNDFKSIEGDRLTGVDSLPVQLGIGAAARTACLFMLVPQLLVVALLLVWAQPLHAAAVGVLTVLQVRMMLRFIAAPREKALWYSGFGVPLYVLGMMVTAFAIRGLVA
jgi:chlorophyll/bacteriochlorophyll a synthase